MIQDTCSCSLSQKLRATRLCWPFPIHFLLLVFVFIGKPSIDKTLHIFKQFQLCPWNKALHVFQQHFRKHPGQYRGQDTRTAIVIWIIRSGVMSSVTLLTKNFLNELPSLSIGILLYTISVFCILPRCIHHKQTSLCPSSRGGLEDSKTPPTCEVCMILSQVMGQPFSKSSIKIVLGNFHFIEIAITWHKIIPTLLNSNIDGVNG